MTTLGYMRVSTKVQSTEIQREGLLRAGVKSEDIYEEKLSGKNRKRPQLEACLARLQPGDTLLIWKLDRLGRSVRDLKDIVEALQDNKIVLKSLHEQIDTESAMGKLFFHILCAFAEFERELILERTSAGLEAALASGKKIGKKPRVPYDPEKIQKALLNKTIKEVTASSGLSFSTVARISSRMEKTI